MGDPFHLTLTELAALIRAGHVSPVEVTSRMLERIEALEPSLHGFVTVAAERAGADARRAEAEIAAGRYRGPLHGVPIALKDMIDTAGIETAAGTKVMAGRVPAEDATVAARLRDAGAVLLGKLALTEGAFSEHRPERPEPRNPWSRDHWTGVSSSGAGVALAAGLAFAALGTDTGGSIRFPCSACGVTGLKPGWGRVSRHGVFPLAASLDHVGPMARSAADCAAMLDVVAGPDPRDPTSLGLAPMRAAPAALDGLRLGVDRALLAAADPVVAEAVSQAIDALAGLKCRIVELALPALEPFAAGWAVTCGVEAAIAHAELFDAAPDDYGPALRGLIELGRAAPASLYAQLHQARLAFAGEMAQLHESAELIALPVLPMPTPLLSTLARAKEDASVVTGMLRFTAPFNYSGQPSLTLPGGRDGDGRPIGFQLIGPAGSERLLLRAGAAFQQASDWHLRRPPEPATSAPARLLEVE